MSESHAKQFAASLTEAAAAFRGSVISLTHNETGAPQGLLDVVMELVAHVNALKLRDVERQKEIQDLKNSLAKWAEWADGRLRA
jgi:hypothetical protein